MFFDASGLTQQNPTPYPKPIQEWLEKHNELISPNS